MTPLDRLKEKYTKAKDAYYNDPNGKTNMSDAEFDKLEDAIKAQDPKWKGFTAGSPVYTKTKKKLPIPMFSLDKAKTEKSLMGFIDEGEPIVIMDKLDGSSLELVYEGGKATQLITRGNGTIGGDVSYLIPHLRGVPQRISSKKRVIIRCEGLFTKVGFEKYRHEFDAARNAASGVLNRKDVHKAIRDLQIVCLSVLEPNMKPSQGLTWLKQNGFRTVAWRKFSHENVSYSMLQQLLEKRKQTGNFQIDGLVLTWDKVNQLPKSGNPTWSLAFKQNIDHDNAPITTIEEVIWKVSSHGYIIPKYRVAPIQMDGATIRNAAAKNPKFAMKMGLGVGARVGLVRSGDIIPEIVKVYSKAKFDLPSPAQFGAYHWDATKTHIVLDDPKANADVRAAKISRCFDILDVDFLRGATVKKLIDAGFDNVTKILKASAEDFLTVQGFKEASANKLWTAIHEKTDKGFSLVKLMNASGVFPRGVGDTRLQAVAEHHNLMQLADMSKAEVVGLISAIPGFQEKTASMIASGLPKFVKWVQRTGLKVTEVKKVKVKLQSKKLAGQAITFTGFRDKEAESLIVSNGGQVVSFGGRTTILLVSPTGKASTKADKAREKGIDVLTLEQFTRKYKL
jgi:DNA ligase (NAD+)